MGGILGGGIGYLSRLWGLSVDQMVEAEVVTAEGQIIVCSEKDNAGEFRIWASLREHGYGDSIC